MSDPHAPDVRRQPPVGLLLALIGIVATLWLSATGQLGLYVHPRYFWFTTVMAALGLVGCLLSLAVRRGRHVHESALPPWVLQVGRLALVAAVAAALLVVPPATLTSSTMAQRRLNAGFEDVVPPRLLGGDPATFRLSDWAAIVADPSAAAGFIGREVRLTGFVTPAPAAGPDVFHLARFAVTCCTVDARPNGIPVKLSGWQQYPVDSWLEVTGTWVEGELNGVRTVLLQPRAVKPIDRPAQPYDY